MIGLFILIGYAIVLALDVFTVLKIYSFNEYSIDYKRQYLNNVIYRFDTLAIMVLLVAVLVELFASVIFNGLDRNIIPLLVSINLYTIARLYGGYKYRYVPLRYLGLPILITQATIIYITVFLN